MSGEKMGAVVRKNVELKRDQVAKNYALDAVVIDKGLTVCMDVGTVGRSFFDKNILRDLLGYPKKRILKIEEKYKQFSCLIANLKASDYRKPLRISLNVNDYVHNGFLKDFFIDLVKWLERNGYINLLIGYNNDDDPEINMQSRIVHTAKLRMELLYHLDIIIEPSSFDVNSLVILREKKVSKKKAPGKRIYYEETSFTKDLKSRILRINEVNSRHVVRTVSNRGLGFVGTNIHAVFNNGSFDFNGRLYTGGFGYQNIPKENRKTIMINGHKTVELDFGGLHPRLLYAMEGIQYDDDPYQAVFPDRKLRTLLKKLLLAIFNSDEDLNAVRSGNYNLIGNFPLQKRLEKLGLTVKDLLEQFKKAHEPISKYFCTKKGYSLMNFDSQIALLVLEHFAEKGEACLCVHDSFLVDQKFEEELRTIMAEAYGTITQEISPLHKKYTCIIK